MLELEAVVMIVGLRTETDLLHHDFCSLGLLLFLTFLLLIEKLLIVEYLTYRRLGGRRDLNQIKPLLFGYFQGLGYRVDAGLDVVAHQTHFTGMDTFVDSVWIL